ncbi:hypothetical protein AB3Z07_13440 [Metabacillus halosaccharovorans]|uniref:hypothetical protein n=1 Tax=Metabacillus halosaccharovorans TaxID=930124 RepID=UPI00203A6671|nr:hypothetical protein [Metabacillus halosaccharovorans]MCM3439239.1 hypothetical protein [Metabacillus halosaccharovorans]
MKARSLFASIGISLVTFAVLAFNDESHVFLNIICSFAGLLILSLSHRFLK